jgi:hypothetical protein
MTNRNSVIFHLILAGMISSVVSVLIDKHSLYDHLKVQYLKELEAEEIIENEKIPKTVE